MPPIDNNDNEAGTNLDETATGETLETGTATGTTSEGEQSPYEKGTDAYIEGLSKADNPFEEGSAEFDRWNEGYEHAEE
jgi:hypothetical protein